MVTMATPKRRAGRVVNILALNGVETHRALLLLLFLLVHGHRRQRSDRSSHRFLDSLLLLPNYFLLLFPNPLLVLLLPCRRYLLPCRSFTSSPRTTAPTAKASALSAALFCCCAFRFCCFRLGALCFFSPASTAAAAPAAAAARLSLPELPPRFFQGSFPVSRYYGLCLLHICPIASTQDKVDLPPRLHQRVRQDSVLFERRP